MAGGRFVLENQGAGGGGYTRETGTIWQTGVLTAERSIFSKKRAQKHVMLGRFALRFQCKSFVQLCVNNGLLARLVL